MDLACQLGDARCLQSLSPLVSLSTLGKGTGSPLSSHNHGSFLGFLKVDLLERLSGEGFIFLRCSLLAFNSCYRVVGVVGSLGSADLPSDVHEAGLGIPVKLLHEGIGHTVTCAFGRCARRGVPVGHGRSQVGWNGRFGEGFFDMGTYGRS